MKSINTYIHERLVLSKDKHRVTAEDFYNALKSYNGGYKISNCTFDLSSYCENNSIEPRFNCFDENENDFPIDWIIVEDKNGINITAVGENQAGKGLSYTFDDFDDFVEEVLNRNGEHQDDPISGEEHLQNIYNILIGK